MNCKPNQLAMLVRVGEDSPPAERELLTFLLGSPVRTTTATTIERSGKPAWNLAEPLEFFDWRITSLADYVLMPIEGEPSAVDAIRERGRSITEEIDR